jgi:hypothetical protein
MSAQGKSPVKGWYDKQDDVTTQSGMEGKQQQYHNISNHLLCI